MIIKPFNSCFLLLILFVALIVFLIAYIFKKKSFKVKNIFICTFAVYNILLFTIYKIMLSLDSDFVFNIYNELPLQLCNINMFLIPLGVILKKEGLKAFGFYFGTLGALLAICFPEPAFINNSIFLFRNIGFYFTHLNIIIMGISLVTLGFFKPSFKALPKLLFVILIISLAIFVFDLLMTKLTSTLVNYFFVMNPAGVSILEIFYKIIKVKYIYMFLPFVLVMIIIFISTIPFEIYYKKKIN